MSLATWVRRTDPDTGVRTGADADGSVRADQPAERSLAEMRPGQSGVIVGWSGALDRAAVRRFEDLGFAEGAAVTVLRRAPLGDPFVYGVAGYEIAVRREHTRHVRVESR
ncbi:FeoA family protein [Flexivirga sp.]|uniref:FeoA family protein n=1 Tax=Flexivirga sp. TaxID=1962927 RepID=UPI003F7E61A5